MHFKLTHCFAFCMVLILGFNTQVHAQKRSKLFSVADYFKVKPEHINRYLELEQDIWKPLQAERAERGIIAAWYLYAVNFTGTDNQYNYVTIVVYDNTDSLEHPWSASIPAKVHPDKTVVEILQESRSISSRVRSEMYEKIISAPEIPTKPSPYIQVNFMRVPQGMSEEYERIEQTIWQPIHQEMVNRGNISGWGLWSLVYPRGDDLAYQYLTLDGVPRYSKLFDIDSEEVFKDVHPDLSDEEIRKLTNQNRATARTELWELIDYVVR